jgi:hypothetical protein
MKNNTPDLIGDVDLQVPVIDISCGAGNSVLLDYENQHM